MDTGANVNAMTLNSLVSDLVTCSNCKREWDGYAQCPCWFDDSDGENDKNEINDLKCDEQLSESDEEEDRADLPKDRNKIKKRENPLDVIYSTFKKGNWNSNGNKLCSITC